ncbi:MAG: anthranilate synthase component 1 [Gammaproteobacteria bacterium]
MTAAARLRTDAPTDRLQVLVRRLEGAPDPLAVFAAAAGNEAPGALFETADAGAQESAQSLLFLDPCLSVRVRGGVVRVEVHDEAAEPIARRLEICITSRELAYAHSRGGAQEEHKRLLADSVLDVLRELVFDLPLANDETAAQIFAYGCFAYDLIDAFESLPEPRQDSTGYPDYSFHLASSVIRIDHRHAATTLATLASAGDEVAARRRLAELARTCQRGTRYERSEAAPVVARVTQSDADYAAVVERVKQHIAAGDVYQIVPSRAWEAPCPDPLAAYARLRVANPSPYMFLLRDPEYTLFGASPESALKVGAASRRVEVHPIAGTRGRGRTAAGEFDAERDTRLELELRLSEKEVAEHVMLVDLARNDIARVAVPGSRRVSELMQVERYSHVMHLVSRVEGKLAPGLDALHAYRATLNMGTLTGAPKLRAAELLRDYEADRRGPYGGAVGYLCGNGDLDTAIVIRSALVQNGVARVQAGAGVVADSDPLAEAEETRRKAQSVLRALGAEEAGDHE